MQYNRGVCLANAAVPIAAPSRDWRRRMTGAVALLGRSLVLPLGAMGLELGLHLRKHRGQLRLLRIC